MDAEEVDGAVGATLQAFTESTEVLCFIDALPSVVYDLRSKEYAEQQFTVILDRYQEQPNLLDPHLEAMISPLLSLAREEVPSPLSQQAFRYLYLISKVRGPKVIVRWFSHEVADLEPVLRLLESQEPQTWETRYILLLWLSIIVIVPFDLSLMDQQRPMIHRIITLGQHYVLQSDKSRDAAAVLLSRALTRPDVQCIKLISFLEWSDSKLSSTDLLSMQSIAAAGGILSTLASVFKLSKREEIVEHASGVLRSLKICNTLNSDNILLRKLSIKLAQRLGTTFLPARVASWRYQRGLRSLADTLSSTTQPSRVQPHPLAPVEDEDWEVGEEVEEIVEILLCGLRDSKAVVRWSAAKGIGRVTNRLPRSLADDVVQSILTCFSGREADTAWHGGCLAVAELGRRGLLLPERLADVVPAVLQSLTYDEMRGTHSVGANVRDAACYVCWAFARAYDPQQMLSHVAKLASGLLVTALFDREINCRRAAAAAFQENVGRQGTFPHGIDILTTVDYFTVANRTSSFINLSAHVAQYEEYAQPLIDHLVHHKLGHWDSALREVAARALHSLTPRLPDYIQEKVLPHLLPLVVTSDPRLRHGALHAVAEVALSLHTLRCSPSHPLSAVLGEELVRQLVDIVPQLESHGVFRGAVGECMRPAALRFIVNMCQCLLPVHGHPALVSWQRVIDANLPHSEHTIRDAAATALHAVSTTYYCNNSPDYPHNLITDYLAGITSSLQFTRMGHCLALGALPYPLLHDQLKPVLEGLVGVASHVEGCDSQYTESRRDAVRALSRVCESVGIGEGRLTQNDVDTVFSTLATALCDYTTDARGDIGVVVREAAMIAVADVCRLLSRAHPAMAAPHMQQMVCLLLQQANEKIDRTRSLACHKLQELLHCQPPLPGIPHHSQLTAFFDEYQLRDWAVAAVTFPLTVQQLSLPEYTYHSLLGLVASCGGLSESTVRASRAALLSYLRGVSTSVESLEPFSATLLDIFRRNIHTTRVTLPLLVTLDLLLSNTVFDVYLPHPQHTFPRALLSLVKQEITRCTDTKKLLASINVFCGLLQFPGIRKNTLSRLMLLLCHRFPRVRRATADQLYATVVMYDDIISDDVMEEVTVVLTDTAWEGDIQHVRERRNQLCDLLTLQIPATRGGGGVVEKPRAVCVRDEMASYRDLVDRAGY